MTRIQLSMTRRILALTGILWLAVYAFGVAIPVGEYGYIPRCPRGYFHCLKYVPVAHDFMSGPLGLNQRVVLSIGAFGVVSVLGFLLALRRGLYGYAGLALVLVMAVLCVCGILGVPSTLNAIRYPADFGFGLTLLVVMELLTPVAVIAATLVEAGYRVRTRRVRHRTFERTHYAFSDPAARTR